MPSSNDKFSDFEETRLNWENKVEEITGSSPDFPKYTTQIMNIANQNAQGTRPNVVGQMSDLYKECPENTFEGWKQWYLDKKPGAIDEAVDRVMPMINNMKEAMDKIDREMVRKWIEDLVVKKTAEGLIAQEAILREIARQEEVDWKPATPEEESKNIDGYIGGQPVSIKPHTYLYKDSSVREDIQVELIFYKTTDKYLYFYREPDS